MEKNPRIHEYISNPRRSLDYMNDLRFILLGEGRLRKSFRKGFAIVDVEDFENLNKFKWTMHEKGYAYSLFRKNGKQYSHRMHRKIVNAPDKTEVDHKNHITFDNRKINLRICSKSENMRNSKKQINCSSIYKGVTFDRFTNNWKATICDKYIGRYALEIEAALAYNLAAAFKFGEFALLNKIDYVN